MIFGDKEKLSIECIVAQRENSDNQTIFGKIAIWSGGFIIGDISLTVILNTPLLFFKKSLNECGNRRSEVLNKMKDEQAWEFLYSALYDSDIDESYDLEKKYRKFCICPGFSEAFDGEIAFLLEDDLGEKFIWKDWQSKQIKAVRLEPETYKNIVESFIRAIQSNSISSYP